MKYLIALLALACCLTPLRAGHDDDALAAIAVAAASRKRPDAAPSPAKEAPKCCGKLNCDCDCGCADGETCRCAAAKKVREEDKPYAAAYLADGWAWDEAGRYWWKPAPKAEVVPATAPTFAPVQYQPQHQPAPQLFPQQQFAPSFQQFAPSFGGGCANGRCGRGG